MQHWSPAKTVTFFLIEGIFVFWDNVEVMLTLVSLDKLQNSTLVCKSSKSESRVF